MTIKAHEMLINSKAFKSMAQPELQEILEDIVKKLQNRVDIQDSIEIAEWVEFLMRDELLIQDGVQSPFLDLLVFAAFTHNINFRRSEDKWSDVFNVRHKLEANEKFASMPKNYKDAILQCVEQQFGKHMPIDNMHPISSTPQYQFAKACSIFYRKGKV